MTSRWISIGMLSVLAACDADTPAEVVPEPEVEEAFWSALAEDRYEDIEDVRATLEDALAENEEDAYLHRTLGTLAFWQVAESSRDPSMDLLGAYELAETTRLELERARDLDPSDPYLPCFLGLIQTTLGGQLGDDALYEAGLAEFERGIALRPHFSMYCRALARGGEPVGSEAFEASLEDFLGVVALCDPSISREAPHAVDPKAIERCTHTARAEHGYNGFWLTGGDLFAKAGELDVAQAFYENARLTSTYEGWSQRELLEQRLAELEANTGLFGDDDPANDPAMSFHGAHTCVMCHAD